MWQPILGGAVLILGLATLYNGLQDDTRASLAEDQALAAEAAASEQNLRIDALYTALEQEQAKTMASGRKLAAPPADDVLKDPSTVDDIEQAPIPGDPGERGETGETGDTGARGPGPSAGQVAEAVDAYCAARDGCRGAVGDQGSGPSPEQVAAAVQTYCDARGECEGPAGADSQVPGQQGETGAAGPQGPGPTDQQVADAVAGYCSDGNCRGPKGDDSTVPGPTGPQGPAGPAPASFTFTIPQSGLQPSRRYICADSDGDGNYACEEVTS